MNNLKIKYIIFMACFACIAPYAMHGVDMRITYGICSYESINIVKLNSKFSPTFNEQVNTNYDYNNGMTPFLAACENNRVKVVKYLVKNCNADITKVDNDGNNALHIASLYSNMEVLMYLIMKKNVDVSAPHNDITRDTCTISINTKNNKGKTPLNYACIHKGRTSMNCYLYNEKGEVPMNNNLDMVKFLIKHGADIHSRDNEGNTILHDACKANNIEVVKYLIEEKDMNMNISNNQGLTCIDYSCKTGFTPTFEYLARRHSDIKTYKDKHGNNALHIACEKSDSDNKDFISYLITQKVPINAKNTRNNNTPLHLTCRSTNEDIDIIILLIENGAFESINEKDEDGETALMYALEEGYTDIVKYLIGKGAKVDNKTLNMMIESFPETYIDTFDVILRSPDKTWMIPAQRWDLLTHIEQKMNTIQDMDIKNRMSQIVAKHKKTEIMLRNNHSFFNNVKRTSHSTMAQLISHKIYQPFTHLYNSAHYEKCESSSSDTQSAEKNDVEMKNITKSNQAKKKLYHSLRKMNDHYSTLQGSCPLLYVMNRDNSGIGKSYKMKHASSYIAKNKLDNLVTSVRMGQAYGSKKFSDIAINCKKK
jgi:ankyrin repeat protein